jgi:predicted DNA-binding transcriptional regulator YafY
VSDQLKYERFFWFHGRIKAEKHPNARHLAEEFEISPRTAQRDIEFMRDRLGAPLLYNYSRRGYRYTDDSYELPGHWINETNILSLAFAVRLASTIPDTALKDDLCRLIDRVTGTVGSKGNACLGRLNDKISVKNIEYGKVDTTIFRQAAEALFQERSLLIDYQSPHTSKNSERIILPLHLIHYMGSWHLVAWCDMRQDLRDFALARIKSIAPSNTTVKLPDDLPPIKEYTRRHFGIMQGEKTTYVTLRFSPKVASWVAEQIWHQEQQTECGPDGSLTLCFPVADFRELARIVLGFGAEIHVIEPPALRDLVREEIRKMAKIYLPV